MRPKKAGLNEDEQMRAVRKSCELLEIEFDEIKDKSPFELSGGQKRKVAIAGVLAVDPDILILDEPVAGLDPYGRKALMDLITKLNEAGKTIIMITHSMDDLAMYAKRVIVLKDGRVIRDATPAEIFAEADALLDMSLDIPEASKIVKLLNEKGKNVPKKYHHRGWAVCLFAGKNQGIGGRYAEEHYAGPILPRRFIHPSAGPTN